MGLSYTIGESLELWRYGKFFLTTISFQIPKEYAITLPWEYQLRVTPAVPVSTIVPAIDLTLYLNEEWVAILDVINFGDTSIPGKIYTEYFIKGNPYPAGVTVMYAPAYTEGYQGATYIRKCNLNSPMSFVIADNVQFKFWNTTGNDPEDVYFEASMYGYTFHTRYYTEVYDIVMRDWVLLQEILTMQRLQTAFDATPNIGALVAEKLGIKDKVDGELAELIAKSIEKAKKPYRQAVIVEYG